MAVQTPGSVLTVTLAGQVMAGGVTSLTVTVNVQTESSAVPGALLAVQVTVVVPFGNAVPEAGTQVTVGMGHPSAVGVL